MIPPPLFVIAPILLVYSGVAAICATLLYRRYWFALYNSVAVGYLLFEIYLGILG